MASYSDYTRVEHSPTQVLRLDDWCVKENLEKIKNKLEVFVSPNPDNDKLKIYVSPTDLTEIGECNIVLFLYNAHPIHNPVEKKTKITDGKLVGKPEKKGFIGYLNEDDLLPNYGQGSLKASSLHGAALIEWVTMNNKGHYGINGKLITKLPLIEWYIESYRGARGRWLGYRDSTRRPGEDKL